MNVILAILHTVDDLDAAVDFMVNGLAFDVVEEGENAKLLDNGMLSVRLIRSDSTSRLATRLELEINTADIHAAMDALLQYDEVYTLNSVHRGCMGQLEVSLQGPHGLVLTLVEAATEDAEWRGERRGGTLFHSVNDEMPEGAGLLPLYPLRHPREDEGKKTNTKRARVYKRKENPKE